MGSALASPGEATGGWVKLMDLAVERWKAELTFCAAYPSCWERPTQFMGVGVAAG